MNRHFALLGGILLVVVVFALSWLITAAPSAPLTLASPLKFVSDRDETLQITTTTKTNDVITYTLVLSGVNVNTTVAVTDVVGANGTVVLGSAAASSGPAPTISGNTVTWAGTVAANSVVTLTFRVKLTGTLSVAQLVNSFSIGNGTITNTSNLVTTTIEPYRAYVPIVRKPRLVFVPIVYR
ncbi:MAG: hypothetical protein NZ693_01625 [Thermoflexales bacterium]|nr:hypothetical protein [Thermoflexales bacterium]